MGIYEEIVNDYINSSRSMVRQINHIKGNNNLEDIQTIVFAAMLGYYGPECLDDIYLAFFNSNFVIADKPIVQLLQEKYEFNLPVASRIAKHCPGTFYDVEGKEFVNSKTKKKHYKFDRTIYVDCNSGIPLDELVKSIIHQVNHVINSIYNPVVSTKGKDSGLAARMGASFDRLSSRTSEGFSMEEAFNTLQTEEILGEVLGFSQLEISDQTIKRLVDEIFNLYTKKGVEDKKVDTLTEAIRPLYESFTFHPVVVDNRISGKLSAIRQEFDSKTQSGSYGEFRELCDKVCDVRISPLVNEANIAKVRTYVKQYVDNQGNANGKV